jgi:hypothetical protein
LGFIRQGQLTGRKRVRCCRWSGLVRNPCDGEVERVPSYSDVKVANRNVRFGTVGQKLLLERRTNPKLSRRTCACEYGVQSCREKSAGVAKRPRERSPTRNPSRHDSATLPSLYSSTHLGLHAVGAVEFLHERLVRHACAVVLAPTVVFTAEINMKIKLSVCVFIVEYDYHRAPTTPPPPRCPLISF